MRNAAAAVAAACVVAACARPMPPTGGERDVMPPRLIGTTPEPLAQVTASNDAVVFRFDERLSERGFSEALVTVSPLDGALRVTRGRQDVRVRIDGGWRANRIYRVVLLPGIRDLFGNAREEAVELVFSTGGPVPNTALAGLVLDRITGAPSREGIVHAVQQPDTARYTAVADTGGFFSLRHLPQGEYEVYAFDDQNRNRRRDLLEPVDSGHSIVIATPTDTITRIFHVLSPDTTPPRVVRAESVDSLHVRITLDDYFDPATGLAAAGVALHALPDSVPYATAVEIIPGPVFARTVAAAAAAQAAAARAAAAQATDAPVRPEVPVAPAAPAAPQETPLLPTRELVARFDRTIVPGPYAITAGGIVNLHGLAGGGTATFDAAEPRAPVAEPDTVSAPPDTARPAPPPLPVPPDTVPQPAPPDTIRRPTARVPRGLQPQRASLPPSVWRTRP